MGINEKDRPVTRGELCDITASKLLSLDADLHALAMWIRSGVAPNRELHRIVANARSGAELLDEAVEVLEVLEREILEGPGDLH